MTAPMSPVQESGRGGSVRCPTRPGLGARLAAALAGAAHLFTTTTTTTGGDSVAPDPTPSARRASLVGRR